MLLLGKLGPSSLGEHVVLSWTWSCSDCCERSPSELKPSVSICHSARLNSPICRCSSWFLTLSQQQTCTLLFIINTLLTDTFSADLPDLTGSVETLPALFFCCSFSLVNLSLFFHQSLAAAGLFVSGWNHLSCWCLVCQAMRQKDHLNPLKGKQCFGALPS